MSIEIGMRLRTATRHDENSPQVLQDNYQTMNRFAGYPLSGHGGIFFFFFFGLFF
ncbi:hypothetical protein BDV28DRAFT_134622, partial [Aspergillus coremiiformis]